MTKASITFSSQLFYCFVNFPTLLFWRFFDLTPSSCDIKKKERQSVSKIKGIGEHQNLEGEKNIFSQDLTTKLHKLNMWDTASSITQRIALEIKAKELM